MMNSKLERALNDAQKLTLNDVCRKFTTYSDEIAFKYLWNLTYKPEYALDKMGLFDEEYLSYYKKVRNYIAEESGHTQFIGISNDYPEELLTALKQDKFALKRILLVIDNALLNYPINELERIKILLTSDKDQCQFGGLKSLKLNNDEANYFIVAVKAIANFFVIKFEEVKKNCEATENNQANKIELNSGDLKNMNKPESIESIPETINEEKEEKFENTIPMVEMLLEHKDSIDKFLEICYDNDSCASSSEKWDVSWLLEKPEVFKKVIHMIKIWDEIKSEFLYYETIFKKAGEIDKSMKIIKYADELKVLGINAKWIWKNKDMVIELFKGLDGASI